MRAKNNDKDALRARIIAVRDSLPADYIRQIQRAHPKYATPSGYNRIANVSRLVICDEAITVLLEKLASITKHNTKQLAEIDLSKIKRNRDESTNL